MGMSNKELLYMNYAQLRAILFVFLFKSLGRNFVWSLDCATEYDLDATNRHLYVFLLRFLDLLQGENDKKNV
jgi:hypothetical protein